MLFTYACINLHVNKYILKFSSWNICTDYTLALTGVSYFRKMMANEYHTPLIKILTWSSFPSLSSKDTGIVNKSRFFINARFFYYYWKTDLMVIVHIIPQNSINLITVASILFTLDEIQPVDAAGLFFTMCCCTTFAITSSFVIRSSYSRKFPLLTDSMDSSWPLSAYFLSPGTKDNYFYYCPKITYLIDSHFLKMPISSMTPQFPCDRD